ncbi:hypothetical protein BGZ88_005024 [Linnemannia elongata]|nr:hypothetical protein BGZ88_005024 [Linnemannia elongata]
MAIDDEPAVKYPSQPPPLSDGKNPQVIIVGAGLAGLFLAILLDKAGIPYQIYERAKEVKPLGALMSLNAGILSPLEQLGLYKDLLKLSLPVTGTFKIYNSDLTLLLAPKNITAQVVGYDHTVFPRPEFYNLLLTKVPREKIHFSKKVMSMEQNKEGVMIRCSDGTTYHGDILVGADGAYSGVRQALYKRMEKAGTLPPSDLDELTKGYICMVGTTEPLDPEQYPGVNSEDANINQIISKDSLYSIRKHSDCYITFTMYCWSAFSVPGNRICWNVKLQLSLEESTEHRFKNSEWGPQSNEAMIKEVRDFLIPFGDNTLGDLIDATPRENISKVFLEDKLFDTWNHGRTVLIGDGLELSDISATLDQFKNERYVKVKAQYEASKTNARLIYGQSYFERFMRMMVFNWLPESVKMKGAYRGVEFRPQASFLPQIPVRGSGPSFEYNVE